MQEVIELMGGELMRKGEANHMILPLGGKE